MCARCRRPKSVCYCAALPALETTTRVVILQHPRERDMPIGTARMASLCLAGAELHVGMRWGEHAGLARALADPARPPILLYPGRDARDVLREPPAGPVTLVVVDGTWSQAKTIVRDNPILQTLPRYAFATPEPSRYRIRKEPSAEYVSTIEALMHVLGVLEGAPEKFRALLAPLDAMVEAQLRCQEGSPRRITRAPRVAHPPRPRVPDLIASRYEDLVVVVGEANAWPYASDHPGDELVHWVARRVATGETFDQIAAPQRPLSPNTRFHTGLADERVLGGIPRDELVAAFARFVRPSDVICAWGHYAPRLFVAAGGTLPERFDLRAAAQRPAHAKIGTLETYAGPLRDPLPIEGRAGTRLALLLQVVAAMRDLRPAVGSIVSHETR